MKKIIIACTCLLLAPALFAQLNKFTEASKYNDFIVNEQTEVAKTIQEFNNAFTNSTDTTVIHNKRRDIITQANKSYKQLLLTEPFRGDTSFIKHGKALFLFYAKTATNEYRQILDIYYDKAISNEEKSKNLKTVIDLIVIKEKEFDTNFLNAQKAFAQKYNIDLK